MKLKTTVSPETLEAYDRIMSAYTVPTPYATDGDCFRDLVEGELEDDPDFVLDIDWLEDEMQCHADRWADMSEDEFAADVSDWAAGYRDEFAMKRHAEMLADHKELARYKRQCKAWSRNAEECPVREIEI